MAQPPIIQLRIGDGDPYVYTQPSTAGSAVIGTDHSESNKLKIVMSNAIGNLDPSSGTIAAGSCSMSIDPSVGGNIEFCPNGTGQTNFARGSVAIEAQAGTAGNLLITNTTAGGLSGVIETGGARFINNFTNGSAFPTNTFVGYNSGAIATQTVNAINDTGIGYGCLGALTDGAQNTCMGTLSANVLTTGNDNVAMGSYALGSADTCSDNVALGHSALFNISGNSSNNNIGIGTNAGQNLTTSCANNVLIGTNVVGTNTDNTTIRIGQGMTKCFISGISGTSVTAVGTVVVDSSGQLGSTSSFPTVWNDVTGASASMIANNGYVADRGTLVTLTLPTTAAFGSRLEIVGKGAGGWTIAQNVGQTIHFNSLDTTTGGGGSLSSTNRYNCVELICVTANTDFVVKSSEGNITVV